jgi:hypothetical protein
MRGAGVVVSILGVVACKGTQPADLVDAAGDGSLPTCIGADQDGDGVCDDVDDCPTVFDPGQLDLDGDHIGWACDPVESTTMHAEHATTDSSLRFAASLLDDTFAAELRSCTNAGGCSSSILAASARGGRNVPSNSSDPKDAWLIGQTDLQGPFLTADHRVLWSRDADTGELDLMTGTYATRATGFVSGSYDLNKSLTLVGERPTLGVADQQLDAPQPDGSLLTIAQVTAAGIPQFNRVPGSSTITVVYPKNDGTSSLRTFMSGATAAAEVLVNGDPLVNPEPLFPSGSDDVVFCVPGPPGSYVQLTASATTVASSLASGCNVGQPAVAGPTLLFVGGEANNTITGDFIRANQSGVIFTEQANGPTFTAGHEIPVVQLGGIDNAVGSVWVVAPDNSVHQLTSTLRGIQISTAGQTVHILGVDGTGVLGNLVLVRYTPTLGVQQVTIDTNESPPAGVLVTTAEGAAIVQGDFANMFVVPSGSMTKTTTSLTLVNAGSKARGDQTALSTTTGLYAYDEVNGVPRFTQLAAGTSTVIYPIDLPNVETSKYFTYSGAGTTCSIARIDEVNGTPALAQMPCAPDGLANQTAVVGPDPAGDLVVQLPANSQFSSQLYVLGASTITEVAVGNSIQPVIDRDASPPTVVGWIGSDATSGFACLARHPDHCWTVPSALAANFTSAQLGASDGEDLFAAAWADRPPATSP